MNLDPFFRFIQLYDRDGVNSIELDEAAWSLGWLLNCSSSSNEEMLFFLSEI